MLFHVFNYRRGHSVITLSHKALYLDPPSPLVHTCSILVTPSPLPLNVQNLTSALPPNPIIIWGDGTILKKMGG